MNVCNSSFAPCAGALWTFLQRGRVLCSYPLAFGSLGVICFSQWNDCRHGAIKLLRNVYVIWISCILAVTMKRACPGWSAVLQKGRKQVVRGQTAHICSSLVSIDMWVSSGEINSDLTVHKMVTINGQWFVNAELPWPEWIELSSDGKQTGTSLFILPFTPPRGITSALFGRL